MSEKSHPHPIVFISYPKSGRTWMRYIFHLLNCEVYFTHAGFGTRRSKLLNRILFESPDLSRLGKKNIFMYRNPLDTAVSMYFQVHKHELFSLNKKLKWDYIQSAILGRLPPKDINKFVLHKTLGVENICRFNRGWLDYFETIPDGVVLSYEDAKKDLGEVIFKFVDYLNISGCDINALIAQSDFDSMKQFELKQESKELRLHGIRAQDPDTMKVRKGVVKGYKDYLSPETIETASLIAQKYGFEI